MDQRPTCPLGLNTFPLLPFALRFLPLASFRQFLLLASPPSIPLAAYVYAVLGVPPTQTDTMTPVLLRLYTRAFNSGCDYGSKAMTVNATVYAAPQALRPDERSSVWKKSAEKGVRSRSTRRSGASDLTWPTSVLQWQMSRDLVKSENCIAALCTIHTTAITVPCVRWSTIVP